MNAQQVGQQQTNAANLAVERTAKPEPQTPVEVLIDSAEYAESRAEDHRKRATEYAAQSERNARAAEREERRAVELRAAATRLAAEA